MDSKEVGKCLVEYYMNAKGIDISNIEMTDSGDAWCLIGEDIGYFIPDYMSGDTISDCLGDNAPEDKTNSKLIGF